MATRTMITETGVGELIRFGATNGASRSEIVANNSAKLEVLFGNEAVGNDNTQRLQGAFELATDPEDTVWYDVGEDFAGDVRKTFICGMYPFMSVFSASNTFNGGERYFIKVPI